MERVCSKFCVKMKQTYLKFYYFAKKKKKNFIKFLYLLRPFIQTAGHFVQHVFYILNSSNKMRGHKTGELK